MVNIIKKILAKPVNSINFDSEEESEFYAWCEEAKQHGFVSDFEYHPPPFVLCERASRIVEVKLKTKTKLEEEFLLNGHEYTPDFRVVPTEKLGKFKHKLKMTDDGVYWIDVKGTFNQHDGLRSFSINQKWVYQVHGIFVNKVVPNTFFPRTWVPESCRYTQSTRKIRKPYLKCKTIREVT